MLDRYAFVCFPPGRHFHYSNLAYGVVEQVIGQVSGVGFESFMRRELFEPLGMQRTILRVPASFKDQRAAVYNSKNQRDRDYHFYPQGGAGFFSTVHDLTRFAMLHLHETGSGAASILKPDTLRAMHGAPSGYANGWGSIKLGAKDRVLVSNGELLGAETTILLLPSSQSAIVCITNINGTPRITDAVAFRIAEALAPGFAKAFAQAEGESEGKERATRPLAPLRGHWVGRIRLADASYRLAVLVKDDNTISVRLDEHEPVRLQEAHFNGQVLSGSFQGAIATTPPGKKTPHIEIELLREGDVLEGVAAAIRPDANPWMAESYVYLCKK
jgi:hypothetical protein